MQCQCKIGEVFNESGVPCLGRIEWTAQNELSRWRICFQLAELGSGKTVRLQVVALSMLALPVGTRVFFCPDA